jgi:glycosyltransferase involved in cell wall biosynthesis
MGKLIFFLFILFAGFWFGQKPHKMKRTEVLVAVCPDEEFPISEHKSFVIVLYAHNQAAWCERALQSIFEQDYDHYRVVMIDDASIDHTEKKAKEFILENHQDEKVLLIRNDTYLGKTASVCRAVDLCLDREIIIELDAKNWLVSPLVLNKLNAAYQNPDVWITQSHALSYPAYELCEKRVLSYYSALFKQIQFADFFDNGKFTQDPSAYLAPLLDLSYGRVRAIKEPIAFDNLAY